ncbi:MAG: Lipocalin-like domain [Bacteroidota bacterium]|jgi:hypothetical protein
MLKKMKWAINFVVLTFIASCGKEIPPPPTNTELLVNATWKFQSASAAGTDISNNAAITCIKDDVITFNASGNGTIAEGAVVCSPTTAAAFTWSFQNSETTLNMSHGLFPGGSGTFNIISLTETTLTISQNVTIPPSATAIPVTAVYIH